MDPRRRSGLAAAAAWGGLALASPWLAGCQHGVGARVSAPATVAVEFSVDLRAEQAAGRFDPARDRVGLRGAVAPLRWDQSLWAEATATPGVYRLRVDFDPAAAGGQPLQHKFKIDPQDGPPSGDLGWEGGRNRVFALAAATAAAPQRVDRVFGADAPAPPLRRTGRIERIEAQPSAFVRPRPVQVWLPPGYAAEPQRRYPVLYLHDGQNVFDAASAGAEWQVDETAQRLVEAGAVAPMIIVAVDHSEDRGLDYTPTVMRRGEERLGGRAGAYGRYLVQELKPLIDARYRSLPGREHTAVGGSSLGGLVSMQLVLAEAATFGAALVVSPSVWWDGRVILQHVAQAGLPAGLAPPRLWVDIGGREGPGAVADARRLRDALQARGWPVRYLEPPEAGHDEVAWAARVEGMLRFLYGR